MLSSCSPFALAGKIGYELFVCEWKGERLLKQPRALHMLGRHSLSHRAAGLALCLDEMPQVKSTTMLRNAYLSPAHPLAKLPGDLYLLPTSLSALSDLVRSSPDLAACQDLESAGSLYPMPKGDCPYLLRIEPRALHVPANHFTTK